MTLGIEAIGSYIPVRRLSNTARKEKFGIDERFLEDKIGVTQVARMAPDEEASGMCAKAFGALRATTGLEPASIEAVVVVTQNPDANIPHVSAKVHGLLGLDQRCACFDVSLGCSGFVHALSIALAFMGANGLKRGLLFTADPYSKVIDEDDKNTSLIFGDGAAVALLSDRPVLVPGKFSFGTMGADWAELCVRNGKLHMNGRAIFNFAARVVTDDVKSVLKLNNVGLESVDRFLFHQGSKYIVDTLAKRLSLPPGKVPFGIREYGNTVSSSIPILLQEELRDPRPERLILISGFGVGLSWASTVLHGH